MNLDGLKFINQEIQMYDIVNVDHNSISAHLSRSDCEAFKKWVSRTVCEDDEDTRCKDRGSDTDW